MEPLSAAKRTHGLPKPEEGIAEWASKIRALQRQVDADEEAEQRRLEEEIRASRLARQRRSRGMYHGNPTDEASLSSLKASLTADSRHDDSDSAIERDKSIPERQSNHDVALEKLTRSDHQQTGTYSQLKSTRPSEKRSAADSKPEPISLAAFIGGRATGPRLNRHAPQQDAHDPTQFEQRKYEGPHPIFGTGGVAMPGMTRRKSVTFKEPEAEVIEKPVSPPVISKSPSTSRVSLDLSEAPQARVRTISSPTFSASRSVRSDLGDGIRTVEKPKLVSLTTSGFDSPGRDIHSDTSDTASSKTIARPVTPRQQANITTHSLQQKSPVTIPYLARPIQPQPKLLPTGPQIPSSAVPSPAFLRPPAQKDPTPSISRLQGRGFVQSMLKVSAELESVQSSPPPKSDTSRTPRKSSVLDRWKPAASMESASPTPTPKSIPLRRSFTTDSAASTSSSLPSQRPTKDTASRETPPQPLQATDTGGLGSATTMVVYKPTKTPDVITAPPVVDEFGFQQPSAQRTEAPASAGLSRPSGKPLTHPTKTRARKPHKVKRSDIADGQAPILEKGELDSEDVDKPQSSSDASIRKDEKHTELEGYLRRGALGFKESRRWPSDPGGPTISPKKPISASNDLIRRALPGMTGSRLEITNSDDFKSSMKPTPVVDHGPRKDTADAKEGASVHHTPSKPMRIPSTGNRPTVMDVAQALNELAPTTDTLAEHVSETERKPSEITSAQTLLPAPPLERRKSSYEKYSSIIMPPLKEEPTPTSTPYGTLSKASMSDQNANETVSPMSQTEADSHPMRSCSDVEANDTVNIPGEPYSPPSVDVDFLLAEPKQFAPQSDLQTVSVEFLSIMGSSTTPLNQECCIFYDTEVLAIIHRYKSRHTGLVSTTVWGWRGKNSTYAEREERKLQDLAKRYGTTLRLIHHYSEPAELVHVLGGELITRQGSRSRWSRENTTMHLVRSTDGMIYIDEHDLTAQNLCSAYSYCVCIVGTVYVWHGSGSSPAEQEAALIYSRTLSDDGSIVELSESGSGDDELFWMALGDGEYAHADYWRWRTTSTAALRSPRIWRVDSSHVAEPVALVEFISGEQNVNSSVYIIDCTWEYFILVGRDARGRRNDIRFAFDVATKLSGRVAHSRPYTPTVHVLVLPSQLPRDLKLSLRDLDEVSLNNGDVPDHMNLLSSVTALDHLNRSSWDKMALQDPTMLPLGIDTAYIR